MKSDRVILVPLPQQAKVRGSNPLGRGRPWTSFGSPARTLWVQGPSKSEETA
jgi:hypothetical protein